MKKLRSAIALLLAVCLLAAGLPLSASAVNYSHVWRNFIVYKNYQSYVGDWVYGKPTHYALLDIDGDGGQELILSTDPSAGSFGQFVVFRYNKSTGEITCSGPTTNLPGSPKYGDQFYLNLRYSPKNHALVYQSMNTGTMFKEFAYLSYSGGKLTVNLILGYDSTGGPREYYKYAASIRSNISESQFRSSIEELRSISFSSVSGLSGNNPHYYDVTGQDYYYQAVEWATRNRITSGVTELTFGPDATCTRAQAVTFLWRAWGSVGVDRKNPFVDVKQSDYYYQAVLWAVDSGITSGVSGSRFDPNAKCTRAQALSMLWRAAGKPNPPGQDSAAFVDVPADSYFFKPAYWALATGIATGTSSAGSASGNVNTEFWYFSPEQGCTRAQLITFLYRYTMGKR